MEKIKNIFASLGVAFGVTTGAMPAVLRIYDWADNISHRMHDAIGYLHYAVPLAAAGAALTVACLGGRATLDYLTRRSACLESQLDLLE